MSSSAQDATGRKREDGWMLPRLQPLVVFSLWVGLAPPTCAQEASIPFAENRIRVAVNVVNVHVTAKTTVGVLLGNLDKRDFEVFEDGERQNLRYFAPPGEAPMSVALLIDASTSQRRVFAREQEIAADFLEQVLRPRDRAAIVSFDSNAYLLQDFTSDVVQLREAIYRIATFAPGVAPVLPPAQAASGTRLCAAVNWLAGLAAERWLDRRVVILISDGVDPEIPACLKPTVTTALRNDLMIYSIRTVDCASYFGDPGAPARGDRALSVLAQETGGLTFRGNDPDRLSAAFNQIAAEIRGQYNLGYTPQNLLRDGRFRRIKVVVKREATTVRARHGYFLSTLAANTHPLN